MPTQNDNRFYRKPAKPAKRESDATSNGPELPPMALVRVEHYEQLQAELAALRADKDSLTTALREARAISDRDARDLSALRARVAELEAALRMKLEATDSRLARAIADDHARAILSAGNAHGEGAGL